MKKLIILVMLLVYLTASNYQVITNNQKIYLSFELPQPGTEVIKRLELYDLYKLQISDMSNRTIISSNITQTNKTIEIEKKIVGSSLRRKATIIAIVVTFIGGFIGGFRVRSDL